MTTRSWTKQYIELRNDARERRGQNDITIDIQEEKKVDESTTTDKNAWIQVYEKVQHDITTIRSQINILRKKHTERLKVNFGERDDEIYDKEIHDITQQITILLKRSSNNCGRIAILGNPDPEHAPISEVEKTTLLNAIRHLSQQLSTLNKEFASTQKSYATGLRELESGTGASLLPEDFNSSSTWDEAMDGSKPLTDHQQQQLHELEQRASQRDAEIIKIVQAVNELAMMFQRLNTLIHEQGTVLDRIDWIIDHARCDVQRGLADVVAADKHSKKSLATKMIGILALIVIILLIIVIYKKSS